jgi:hypothetical protein
MNRTETGTIFDVETRPNGMKAVTILLPINSMFPRTEDGTVVLSWDEPEARPPCKHLKYSKDARKFIAKNYMSAFFVTYCPECGTRVPEGYEA